MFQSQTLSWLDSTLAIVSVELFLRPFLLCCVSAPNALLVYFFYFSDLLPPLPPTPPPPAPRTSTLVLSVWNTPPPGGKGVTMWLLPCLLPAAPSQCVSLCSAPQHTRIPAFPPPVVFIRPLSLGARCLTVHLCLACVFSAVKPFGLLTLLHLNYTRNLTIRNYIRHKTSVHAVLCWLRYGRVGTALV